MEQAAEIAWDPFQDLLRELYLEQDLSLAAIMREMATEHQFKATKAQYELQFKKWKFRKNRTAGEWKIVASKLGKRKNEHKESEVLLNGSLISAKKLRKETLRYGSTSTAIQIQPLGPSPPTPEDFVIRTPSPKLTTSMPMLNAYPSINISSIQLSCLPFYQFNSVFCHEGNPFLFTPENSGFDLEVLPGDNHSSVLRELIERNGKRVSGSTSGTIKALLPENIFPYSPTAGDMAISNRQPSSDLQFLKLSMYLASNNFFGSTTVVSKKIYQWVQHRSNAGLMEYILSIGGPTVEALAENLFRLALDDEDVRTINKLMKLGINPNEQVYRTEWSHCRTPLLQACSMQNLKLVRALIGGGARLDHPEDTESALVYALDFRDGNGGLKAHADPELVRILLNAGAVVNPNSGGSPLGSAAYWGHVEVVNPNSGGSPLGSAAYWGHVEVVSLLVSAGADVNIATGDGNRTSTPLMKAIECELTITNVISMVRILLLAGADPQGVSIYDKKVVTPLEAAMSKESIELIQLLLDNGARVTEGSFVQAVHFCDITVMKLLLNSGAKVTEGSLVEAVHFCDITVVKLLLNSGGKVTEPVIECAVEHNSMLVFFLLETTDNRIKTRCKTAAFIKSIECGEMALIQELCVSGAQLIKNSKLKAAIRQVMKAGNMQVLSFLLDEKSEYQTVSLESLDSELRIAIHDRRNDIVELLLSSGANINSEYNDLGLSPLVEAISWKDSKLAKQLLVAGAAVNGTDCTPYFSGCTQTVLPAAVDWGYYPLIQDIINVGAEIDAHGIGGTGSALFVAAGKKNKEAIKLLIDAGANVNASGSVRTGQTALMAASRNNDLPTVQYLLELGADPDEWSLTVGITTGSVELVETLLGARLHRYKRYSRGYGCGALQHAIRLKDAIMIKVLLVNGIDANAIFNVKAGDEVLMASKRHTKRGSNTSREPDLQSGKSALGYAIESKECNDSMIVRLLLEGGADPNSIVTNNYRTALLVAIDAGNFGLVKVLIAAGADANPELRYGVKRTPLQLAVERGRIDIVNTLLDNGADINMGPFDRYGATALQFAAIGGYIGIAQLLVQRGADVNASAAKIGGRTALEGAAEHGRIDMVQFLLNYGAEIIGTGARQYDRALELALGNGHRALSRLLEKNNRDTWDNLAAGCDMIVDSGYV